MKTLVTGATGFLGSVLVRQLLEEGANVRILRRSHSKLDLLGSCTGEVEHVIGDVRDPSSLADALEGVDKVYHVAGYIAVAANDRKTVERMRRINVDGTAHMVDAALAAGVERLVHTSSIAAVGRPADPATVARESIPWNPTRLTSHYAISKRDAELQVHRGIAEGLDAVFCNPSLIFGPGRLGENTMLLFEAVKKYPRLRVPSGGTNVVDVEDVARGHRLAMERGIRGERYILGGENLLWATIFVELANAAGIDPPTRPLSPTLAMVLVAAVQCGFRLFGRRPLVDRKMVREMFATWQYSSDKAATDLGYTFRPFAATAARMAQAPS